MDAAECLNGDGDASTHRRKRMKGAAQTEEFVRSFEGLDIGALSDFLRACPQPFAPSELYASATDTKYVDTQLRVSEFRSIVDKQLFDIVEQLVDGATADDPKFHYILRRNDVQHIRYQPGGFFKPHRDYLSTVSNTLEEITMLICCTPEAAAACEGGGTKIHSYTTAQVYATNAPGCAVLFRKDLEHECMPLVSGEKHIVSLNLWAMKKRSATEKKQVMLVTFPRDGAAAAAGGGSAAAAGGGGSAAAAGGSSAGVPTALQVAADASRTYAIPTDVLVGPLATYAECADDSAVIEYECTNFSFEEFGTVAKVLRRAYCSEGQISAHKRALDFFGPFDLSSILVDLSTEPPPTSASASSDVQMQTYPSMDTDVIVCESEARADAVAAAANDMGEPFVKFKMMFVEGVMETSGDGPGYGKVEIPMTAACICAGDYGNIFSIRHVAKYDEPEAMDMRSLLMQEVDAFDWQDNDGDEYYELQHQLCLGLQAGLGNDSDCSNVAKFVFFGELGHPPLDELVRLPGCGAIAIVVGTHVEANIDGSGEFCAARVVRANADGTFCVRCDDDSDEEQEVHANDVRVHRDGPGVQVAASPALDDPRPPPVSPADDADESLLLRNTLNDDYDKAALFHLDKHGKSCFTAAEARKASTHLAAMQLDSKVKEALNQQRFELPQQTEKVHNFFCNETVYGKLNVLWVSGGEFQTSVARPPATYRP